MSVKVWVGVVVVPVLLCVLFAFTGCASIIRGTRQAVTISSEPEGAAVSIDGANVGITPARPSISRRGPHVISLSKEGYKTQVLQVESSYDFYWIPINVVWGAGFVAPILGISDIGWGILGAAGFPIAVLIDHITGGVYRPTQTNFHVQLTRAEPSTFFNSMEPSWAIIEFRPDVSHDDAWRKVRDILIKKFDIEVVERADGYLRTAWLYTWTGEYRPDYRVRVTGKFRFEDRNVEVKTEAQYGREGQWTQGYDTALLALIKADIMGAIGAVTK
jgi:hypothetical protein